MAKKMNFAKSYIVKTKKSLEVEQNLSRSELE